MLSLKENVCKKVNTNILINIPRKMLSTMVYIIVFNGLFYITLNMYYCSVHGALQLISEMQHIHKKF
jgi:hypothetical protein